MIATIEEGFFASLRMTETIRALRSCHNRRASMRNIKFTIAYDGTDFSGWQVQPGQCTVQGVLSDILEQITQRPATIYAAGRTDAGVHAKGQVVNFKTASAMTLQDFQRALNALLPPAIRVNAAEEVSPDFHSRWDALAKTYRSASFAAAWCRRLCGNMCITIHARWILRSMAAAARHFLGEHDFTTFAASTGSRKIDRERQMTRTSIGLNGCARPSRMREMRKRSGRTWCAEDRSCAIW